ncbi:hypothetical protein GbCGDNIH7_7070 [Granulibacter bethesdensis]|nr:hypothetical protein GbCGDNIH4_7070a [Granulibacter bethesdensis CGDNIH4]APH60282.1 hypothetical protein GbCGDNIH7_7070 [Granulibacter bethesdensis]
MSSSIPFSDRLRATGTRRGYRYPVAPDVFLLDIQGQPHDAAVTYRGLT